MAIMNVSGQTELANFIPEFWSRDLYQQARAQMVWEQFTGGVGSGMPVIRKTELLANPGDTIHINRMNNLTGAGVGAGQLEGNEEQLTSDTISLVPTWKRNGVATSVPANAQINFEFRTQARDQLAYWLANKMDEDKWTAASLTTASGFDAVAPDVIYGGNATSVNTLDSSDDFSVTQMRNGAAIMHNKKVRGIRVPDLPGREYYVMFIHPYQALSLMQDTEWIAAQNNAQIRGSNNPIFTGALGEFAGVVPYVTTNCTRVQNANSPVIYTARAIMMGAEALAHAENENIVWVEQMRDYEFEMGISIRAAYEDKIMDVNAILQVVTACVGPTD